MAVRVQVPLRVPWETSNKINDKQCRVSHLRVVFLCLLFSFAIVSPLAFAIGFRHWAMEKKGVIAPQPPAR